MLSITKAKTLLNKNQEYKLTNQEVEQVIAFLTLLGQIRMRTLKLKINETCNYHVPRQQ